jgi:chromosome partitioning protein
MSRPANFAVENLWRPCGSHRPSADASAVHPAFSETLLDLIIAAPAAILEPAGDVYMRVAAAVQLKGGTGKSTMTVNAAVAAEARGLSVAIADTDPQASSALWAAARGRDTPYVMSITAGQLPGWIAENQDAFDLTFVDTPAHDTDTLADAAKLADLAIIVTEPTYLANAVAARIRTAFVQEKIEYAILMTRTPYRLNGRLNHWLALHRELGTVVDAHLAYRVAYQDAVALGLGVVEYEPDGPAAHEVRAATDWILKKLELAS